MATVQEVKDLMTALQKESSENITKMLKDIMKDVADKFGKQETSEKGDNEKSTNQGITKVKKRNIMNGW